MFYGAQDKSQNGATENAEHDIARPSKLLGLTSRDWTMRHHIARVDIARPDNAVPETGVHFLCCIE